MASVPAEFRKQLAVFLAMRFAGRAAQLADVRFRVQHDNQVAVVGRQNAQRLDLQRGGRLVVVRVCPRRPPSPSSKVTASIRWSQGA